MILALALAAALPGQARVSALDPVLRSVHEQIEARDDLSEEDRAEWRDAFDRSVALWTTFRDAECDADLVGDGGVASCRAAITRVIAQDLSYRFELEPKGKARASATEAGPPAEGKDPCEHAPPGDCDYCGINACWKARLAKDDVALNRAWQAGLTAIRAKPKLTPAARADWIAHLRTSQRAWLAWRDAECDVERWETPNRFAHSIYAQIVAPCIDRETLARTRALRQRYR